MAIRKNNKLAQDLTLVLMRGNGSPRAFRIRVPNLARSLISLSGVFLLLSLCTFAFFATLLWHNRDFSLPRIRIANNSTETGNASPAAVNALPDTSQSNIDAIPAPDASFKEEFLKLQREWEGRKTLAPGTASSQTAMINAPIQLLGPQSTLLPPEQSPVEVKNLRSSRNGTALTLNFDLQNRDSEQKQVRGYIVALAKTAKALYGYPEGVLSPKDNILVNYAKGETFAISRFRQAAATFAQIPVDSGPIHFQVFLFHADGKILLSSHIEGK
jgi:hypothetical protein